MTCRHRASMCERNPTRPKEALSPFHEGWISLRAIDVLRSLVSATVSRQENSRCCQRVLGGLNSPQPCRNISIVTRSVTPASQGSQRRQTRSMGLQRTRPWMDSRSARQRSRRRLGEIEDERERVRRYLDRISCRGGNREARLVLSRAARLWGSSR